jgi:hypothetical protein
MFLITVGTYIAYKCSSKFKQKLIWLKDIIFWNPIIKAFVTVFLHQVYTQMKVIRQTID